VEVTIELDWTRIGEVPADLQRRWRKRRVQPPPLMPCPIRSARICPPGRVRQGPRRRASGGSPGLWPKLAQD